MAGTSQARPEGDPRARRHAQTKARIVQEAWKLAAEKGVAGVSLGELAQRVGLRQPSLYTYFASKNDLYDQMFAQGARALAQALAKRPESADPRETLRVRVRAYIEFCTADPARYQLLEQRPIPGFEPSPESFQITVGALAATRADLEAAGVCGEAALDMFRALITGLISQQIANEPGGDRWVRLQDDALTMFLAHHSAQANKAHLSRARLPRNVPLSPWQARSSPDAVVPNPHRRTTLDGGPVLAPIGRRERRTPCRSSAHRISRSS